MQRKQVKQVAKPKAAAKPAKTAAKAAGKAAPKSAGKTAAKPAAKAPAKSATKATPKATSKATSPAKPVAKTAGKVKPVAKTAAKAPAAERDDRGAARSTSRSVVKPTSRHRHDDTSTLPVPVPKAAVTTPVIPKRAFTFEDAGRTFNARVEPLRPSGSDAWWWFDVSTEQHQRHAPFRAEAGDSIDEVRARIVRYYDELLARRAEPAPSRWNRRPSTPGTAAVASPDEADAPEGEEAPDEEGIDDIEGGEGGDEPEMVDLSEAEGIADATA